MFNWFRKKAAPPAPPADPVEETQSIHVPHYWGGYSPAAVANVDRCHAEIVEKVRGFLFRAKNQFGQKKLMVPCGDSYRIVSPSELGALLSALFIVVAGDGSNRFLGQVDPDSAMRLHRFLLSDRAKLDPPPTAAACFSHETPPDESWDAPWYPDGGLGKFFSL
jgi:hypothetical protein